MADLTTNPGIVAPTRDPNTVTNQFFVQLTNGTAGVTMTGTTLDVTEANSAAILADTAAIDTSTATIAGSIHVEDTAHTTADPGVQVLAVRNDTQAALAGTTGDYIPLTTNATGALYVSLDGESLTTSFAAAGVDDAAFGIATDSVVYSGYLADETAPDSVDEGDAGIARMTLDRKQLMVLADATTDSQRLGIDASGHAQVDLAAVSVTAVPVSADSNANTLTNPIYVQVVEDSVSSNEVQDYDTAASVASDATDNHDYTVTGTTFFLKQIIASSSAALKAELSVGPVASLVSKGVWFVTGREGGTVSETFAVPIEVPVASTGTARLARTNLGPLAADVYSTIIGYDI